MADFTGGLNPLDDYPLLEQPAGDPWYGENHAFWICDSGCRYFIYGHVNSVETFWPLRIDTVHVCMPNGRALVAKGTGTLTSSDTVGGANLYFQCIEPFKRWQAKFQGLMCETTQLDLAKGPVSEESCRKLIVDWEADLTVAAPPFIQGGTADTGQGMVETSAGRFIGGSRYEQLVRADVRFHVVGEGETEFSGTATRTHRRGTRNLVEYAGHDWQSALFPGGDGFFFMRFPRRDGSLAWSEAYVLKAGKVVPAKVLSDTWRTTRQVAGEKMPIRLESEHGISEIEGTTLGTVFRPILPTTGSRLEHNWGVHTGSRDAVANGQGWARYVMNGEETTGLCERSIFADRL